MDNAEMESNKKDRRVFSMRWKLLLLFGGTFTLIFVFVAVWILQFTTGQAKDRLVNQLAVTAKGAATTLDAKKYIELVATVEKVDDPKAESGYGFPTDPLFVDLSQNLFDVNQVLNEALAYSYFKDSKDGQLYFGATSGYFLKPQGVPYRFPVSKVVNAQTLALMERGLASPVSQPEYTDTYGSWISAYSPILDGKGKSIGAVGVDYPVTYVSEVRSEVTRKLIPILVIIYLVLIVLVVLIATSIVRPIKRLTEASARIAEGEYDLNLRSLISERFPDEMYVLANSFAEMASKVDVREKSLTQEVKRLKVEIDHARRADSVREITESDSFAELAVKAAEMRKRMHRDE